MTIKNRKVLIIGIDGGTWTILKPALEQGCMPFLKQLCRNGASGILESTIPAITPAAWGAFQTGKNPGKTGMFHFSYWDKNDKTSHYMNSLHLGETVWEILSRYGKRVAVLNVPMTYPPRPLNGYLISGLPTPSMESDFTWPAELKRQIMEEVPEYHIFDLKKISEYSSEEDRLEQFVRQMADITETRTRAAVWLLKKDPLDVFMVHFQATDVVQHVYWHYMDNSHPLFDSSKQKYLFENFYRILDQKIAMIHKVFSEQNGLPVTVIISDHGFQANYKRFNLGNWLAEEGYLKIRKNASPHKIPFLKKITRKLHLGKILSSIFPKDAIAGIDRKYVSRKEFICWDETLAYSMGNNSEAFIYLIKDDPEQRLAKQLAEKIMQIRDAATNKPIAQKVWMKKELFHGSHMDNLPDIIVVPAEEYTFKGIYQFDEELFHTINPQMDMHMGKHHSHGILVLTGETVIQNHQVYTNIINIAPTLLYYLGIPIPEDMDGRAQLNFFNCVYETTARSQNEMASPGHDINADIYTDKEIGEVEQRLKDLGYL